MKRTTLAGWLRRNLELPLSLMLVCIALQAGLHVFNLYSDKAYFLESHLDQNLHLIQLAESQQDRRLLASALENLRRVSDATWIGLFRGNQLVQSTENQGQRPRRFWISRSEHPIPGGMGLRLVAFHKPFFLHGNLPFMILTALVVVGLIWFLSRRLEIRFQRDLISPLRKGLMTNSPIPIHELEKLRQDQKAALNATIEKERAKAVALKAHQVAHDIKSPLSALIALVSKVSSANSHDRQTLVTAIKRIRDITEDLSIGKTKSDWLDTPGNTETDDKTPLHLPQPIGILLESAIQETCLAHPDFPSQKIEWIRPESAFGLFVDVIPSDFRRAITNLLTNSIEATIDASGNASGDNAKSIRIELFETAQGIQLTIEDHGLGIEPEHIQHLFQPGFTYGKPKGTGLGLYQVKQVVDSVGGTIHVRSQRGMGSTFVLTFLKALSPTWFLPNLTILSSSTLVVVDDNPKQLQIWEKIADKAEIDFSGYLDPRDVEKEVSLRQNRNKVIFVFDFSLGLGNKNGLEWIESLDLGRNAILSTHFSESIEIQSQCIEKKIPLLPKQWVSWLPIVRRLPHGFSEPLPVKLSGNTVPVTISS